MQYSIICFVAFISLSRIPIFAEDFNYDNGPATPGELILKEISIPNKGAVAWNVVQIKKSCTCIGITDVPSSVPAGGSLDFTVAFKAGEILGPESMQVQVFLKDSDGAPLQTKTIRLSVEVSDYLNFPKTNSFVQPGGNNAMELERGDYPEKWDRVSATAVGLSNMFNVECAAVDESHYRLKLELRDGPERGIFKDLVEFKFYKDGIELKYKKHLPIRGSLAGNWVAAPSSVVFGALREGETREEKISLSPEAGVQSDEILDLSTSDPNRAQSTLIKTSDGNPAISLRFTALLPVGQASGELLIKTKSGQRIHVPYRAAVANKAIP